MRYNKNSVLASIGKICAGARIANNTTQEEIGNYVNYTRYNISRFERGMCNNAVILLFYMRNFCSNDDNNLIIEKLRCNELYEEFEEFGICEYRKITPKRASKSGAEPRKKC